MTCRSDSSRTPRTCGSRSRSAAIATANYFRHLEKSLHGTTAGHLGDGFYEHGIESGKQPHYSIFPVRDDDGERGPHALLKTEQVPGFRRNGPKDRIETHYSDLPRKACMHCHLYSEGRAIDGRVGMDGDYRGEGCAACHVTYGEDGRSRSDDPTIPKFEPRASAKTPLHQQDPNRDLHALPLRRRQHRDALQGAGATGTRHAGRPRGTRYN